jgi:hypothetical protein
VVVLATTLLLAWVPALGSGYGPQYVAWFLPLGVVLYAVAGRSLRLALLAFAVVAVLTYLVEYAFIGTQGAFMTLLAPHTAGLIGQRLSSQSASTLLRLPLFLAYLLALATGVTTLIRSAPR